jgi:hypothetical protein
MLCLGSCRSLAPLSSFPPMRPFCDTVRCRPARKVKAVHRLLFEPEGEPWRERERAAAVEPDLFISANIFGLR